jgi:ribosomal protein S18 acetylase RimI-like enzyme
MSRAGTPASMGPAIELRALVAADAPACDAIIASLPYFFGDPQGVRECAEAVRTQRGIVAVSGGAVAGFITIAEFGKSAEVTWLAVHASQRRRGIGRMLVERAVEQLRATGTRLLFVLTLGPSISEPPEVTDNYAGTRAFYERLGFVSLREFALKTWNDPAALILARPLTSND